MRELDGILIPCFEEHKGRIFHFKLGTATKELLLDVPPRLQGSAQKAGWEEVKLKTRPSSDGYVAKVEDLEIVDSYNPVFAEDETIDLAM